MQAVKIGSSVFRWSLLRGIPSNQGPLHGSSCRILCGSRWVKNGMGQVLPDSMETMKEARLCLVRDLLPSG